MEKNKTYQEFYTQHPEAASAKSVLKAISRKARHALKHYEDDEIEECIEHLDDLHSMVETFVKLYKQKGAI